MNKIIAPTWIKSRQRWQVNVTIDGKRRTFVSGIPGRKGQQECFAKAQAALNGKQTVSRKIKDVYAAFLLDADSRTSIGNVTNLESIGRIWILPRLGEKQTGRLTQQDIQDVLNDAFKAGRSRKTISNIRGAFTAFLRYARKAKLSDLRADDVDIPNDARKGERKVLTREDISKLFSSDETTFNGTVIHDPYIHAYRFLVLTGIRPGELCDLRKGKQSTEGAIAVTGAYNRFKEHTEGKTGNAKRTFFLTDRAVAVLNDQAASLKARGIVSPFIFPARDGLQLDVTNLYAAWRRYKLHNGISNVSVYELRHTFVSICQHTIPEALIKPVLGHSSAMPSYQTYGHIMEGDAALVRDMISASYDEVFEKR